MSDGVTYLGLIVGFGFVLVAGARLGAGSHQSLGGLFAARGRRDWPTGVQEGDAPRFAVAHLDALRPARQVTLDAASRAELIDLGSRRLEAPRS